MEYRRLGHSGMKVPVVGLGCNNFGGRTERQQSIRVIHEAIDFQMTLLDTADVYSRGESERIVGEAIQGRRDKVLLATKFRSPMGDGPHERGGSRLWVRKAVEASLNRLSTDYIDLYQMHAPDEGTPIEETLSVLQDLIREGKVRYIGSSNFAGWQIADAAWVARSRHWEPFISAQNHYSLLHRDVEKEVIPACAQFGVGMIPYLPLAGGMLTGKHRRGQEPQAGTRLATGPGRDRFLTERNFDIVEQLERFAQERDISLLHVAIGGLAAQPEVSSVIAGATRPEQVEANFHAGLWKPSDDELAEMNSIASARGTPQP